MKRFAMLAALLAVTLTAAPARAQLVVSEPILDNLDAQQLRTVWMQYVKQAQQVATQINQWKVEYENFKRYGIGSWVDLRGELNRIQNSVQQAMNTPGGNAVGADAQAQQQLFQQDLGMLDQIKRMNDSAAGSAQIAQATNYFLQALLADSMKARKLQIDRALVEETGRKNYSILMQRDLNTYVRP